MNNLREMSKRDRNSKESIKRLKRLRRFRPKRAGSRNWKMKEISTKPNWTLLIRFKGIRK